MLYFDESGYTGPDLTNNNQPFFSLASVRLTNNEAETIKRDIEYDKWGKELHFSKMYTNYKGRLFLDRVFSHPLMDSNHVLLSFAFKRYCIYAHIVNVLLETFYFNQGTNLYENAMHLYLANGLYYHAESHPNKELVAEFECNFVKMMRNPSGDSIADFYKTTDELMSDPNTLKGHFEMLSLIPQTIIFINEAISEECFYLDLTIPLFSSSVQEWYSKTGEKDDIMFDSSEPFYSNKAFIEKLRDMDVPEKEVGYGKGKHVYPLPVGRIEIAKSHDEFGIQLADVFASALNFALTPRNDKYRTYQDKLKTLKVFQDININVAPSSIDYIKERMEETAETDPIEFLCEHEKEIYHDN